MRQLFWTIFWVDLETETVWSTICSWECGLFCAQAELTVGLAESTQSYFILHNFQYRNEGGWDWPGGRGQLWCRHHITSHPSKYSSPLQPLHQCPSQAGLRQQIFLCETNVYRGDGRLSLYCASIHEWVLSGILRRLCPYKLTQGL